MKLFNGKRFKRILPRKRISSDQEGSTLIEAVFALIIIAIAGIGVSSVFLYSSRSNAGGTDRAVAGALAQDQMEMKRGVLFKDLTPGVTTESITAGPPGAVRRYTIVTTISDNNLMTSYYNASGLLISSPNIEQKQIRVQVTPEADSSRWSTGTVDLITLRSPLTNGPHTEANPLPFASPTPKTK